MFNKKKQKPHVRQQAVHVQYDKKSIELESLELPKYTDEQSGLTIMSHLGKALLTYSCEEDLSYNKYFIDNTPTDFQPIIERLDNNDASRIDKVINSTKTLMQNVCKPLDYAPIVSEYDGVSSEANDVEVTLL